MNRRIALFTRAAAVAALATTFLPSQDARADDASHLETGTALAAPPNRDVTNVATADNLGGGSYTTPTLLFVPAGAVPAWNMRAIVLTELQSPSDIHAGFRPGAGVELGLPFGVTLGAGTDWVGGDVSPDTGKIDFNLGLSPYAQARVHLLGDPNGRGFQLGASATYKFVGFEGDPGEMEAALSAQLRQSRFEVGLEGVLGKDFGTTDADGEVHAYAVVRALRVLALGAAAQARTAIVSQPGETTYDVIGGGIASLTLDRYQVAALAGEGSQGLAQGHFGALGQLFATARF